MKKCLLMTIVLCISAMLLISCTSPGGNNSAGNQNKPQGSNQDPSLDVVGVSLPVWSEDIKTLIIVAESDDYGLSNELYNHIYDLTDVLPKVNNADMDGYDGKIILGNDKSTAAEKAYRRLNNYVDFEDLAANGESAWLLYAEDGKLVVAYSDVFAMRDAVNYILNNGTEATYKPVAGVVSRETFTTKDYLSELRKEDQADEFIAIEEALGTPAMEALKNVYSLYTEDLYIWLASLWCPDTGAFYYSRSARDNIGFLPDLESSGQALKILQNTGLANAFGDNWAKMLPKEITDKLLNFAMGLQSPDGYFYHPQWDTSITRSRRGRDAGWAKQIITGLGHEPLYDYGSDTSTDNTSHLVKLSAPLRSYSTVDAVSKVVPTAASNAIYESEATFIAYLDSLKFNVNSYSAGNTINSTVGEIKRYGMWNTLIAYLTEHQNKNNGLWEDEVSYQSVNGLMKLCTCFGKEFPNAEKALDSAMEILTKEIDDELTGITFVYNPWVAISKLLGAVSTDKKTELRNMLWENAEDIFMMTAEKLAAFKKLDGGFSYLRDYSSPFSQDALVAVSGSAESDVNATTIGISTVVVYMSEVFGLDFPKVFSDYEGAYFNQVILGMQTIVKDEGLAEPPETITFDDYDPSDATIDANVVTNPVYAVTNTIGDTETNGVNYAWFESKVLSGAEGVPGKEADDYVLYVKDFAYDKDGNGDYKTTDTDKEVAETASSTTFSITNMVAAGNCYTFEADMYFIGTSDPSSPVAQITFIRENTALISAWVDMYQYERFGQKYLRIQEYFAGTDGVKDKEVAAGIPVGEWFKLRIEMYKEYSGEGGALMTKMKIFVNDKFAGVSDSGHYEKGAYKDFLVSAVKLSYYRHADSAFYIDNVYAAKSRDEFKYESVSGGDGDETVSNKVIWDFESGIPSQDENFSEIYYKDKTTGENVLADPSKWSPELESIYGGKNSGGAKLYSVADPKNAANKVIKSYSFNSKSAVHNATMYVEDNLTVAGAKTWEVEFDYYFEKIEWLYAATFFSVDFQNSVGSSLAGISFKALGWETSHKNAEVLQINLSDGTALDNFGIYADQWYTFKIVYHYNELDPADSKFVMYNLNAEGKYECIANTTLAAKAGAIDRVGFGFRAYEIRGTQYIDDVSVARTNTEYVFSKPIEGEIVIPGLVDNNIYITTTSRGKGQFYELAEKFKATHTHELLIQMGIMAQNTVRGDGVSAGTRTISFAGVDGSEALTYTSLGSGNNALDFVAKTPAVDGFVFETDIKLKGVDTTEGRDLRFTGTTTNGVADSALYNFNVKFHKNPHEKGGYVVTIGGSKNEGIKYAIPENTWVNVRLVAEGLAKDSPLKFYINNQLLIETTLESSIAGITGMEFYTPSTYSGHGWETGSVSIDNIYVSGTGEYIPPTLADKFERGQGEYADSAIKYTGATYDSLIADGLMVKNTASTRGDGISDGLRTLSFVEMGSDTALVYKAIGNGNRAINFLPQSTTGEGFVFETDIMLDGAGASKDRGIAFVGNGTLGTGEAQVWGLNIKFIPNTETDDGGYLLTASGIDWKGIVPDKTWVNIRFEALSVASGGKINFYLNGELVATGALKSAISGLKSLELYTPSTNGTQKGFDEGSICLDNTYVSRFNPPLPIVEGSSRGEGEYKADAISYAGTTYAQLISGGLMAANTKRGDGVSQGTRTISLSDDALVYTSLSSGISALNFVSQNTAYSGFVFETDIKLTDVDTTTGREITFRGTKTNGTADGDLWGISLKFAANADTTVGGYVVSMNGTDEKVVIKENTWVNVRVVTEGLAVDSAIHLYINGVKTLSGKLKYAISGIKGVELYTQSTYNGQQGWTKGSISLDNTYVSGLGEAPVVDPDEVTNGGNMDDAWTKP